LELPPRAGRMRQMQVENQPSSQGENKSITNRCRSVSINQLHESLQLIVLRIYPEISQHIFARHSGRYCIISKGKNCVSAKIVKDEHEQVRVSGQLKSISGVVICRGVIVGWGIVGSGIVEEMVSKEIWRVKLYLCPR
jgi:hypothetical protein